MEKNSSDQFVDIADMIAGKNIADSHFSVWTRSIMVYDIVL